jgi:hypothetical protein
MFARFRRTGRRLYVSVVAISRTSSTLHHSHLISLGSLPQEWTIDERSAFWDRVHQKLAPLGSTPRALILEAIHARIPKLTPTEMQAEQAQRVAAEVRRIEAEIRRHLNLAARQAIRVAELRRSIAAHKRAAAKAEAARERLTQIKADAKESANSGNYSVR